MPTAGTEFAITAPTVFDGERFWTDHCVIVQGQRVAQTLPAGDCPAGLAVIALEQGIVAPGLSTLR